MKIIQANLVTECLIAEQSIRVNLALNSWIELVPNVMQLKKQEFDCLWQLHPLTQDTITLYGKTHKIPRFQQLYGEGLQYKYSGKQFYSTAIDSPVITQALAYVNSCEPAFSYNGVLANWYESGSHSMGLHADDEPELIKQAPIYSFSFGEVRLFRIRAKLGTFKLDLLLLPGMLLKMGGEMQSHFKHELPKSKGVLAPRVNLTIRAFNKLATRR